MVDEEEWRSGRVEGWWGERWGGMGQVREGKGWVKGGRGQGRGEGRGQERGGGRGQRRVQGERRAGWG